MVYQTILALGARVPQVTMPNCVYQLATLKNDLWLAKNDRTIHGNLQPRIHSTVSR